MKTFIAPKKDTQEMIKALRQAGLQVDKLDAGYQCIGINGDVIFKAMVGHHDYLIRTVDDLFVA